MATIINASVDLSKVDKSKIFKKDGREWLSIAIAINDETKYGNNVGISIAQSKEEREAKADRTYLGNGKVVWTDGVIKVVEKEQPTQPPVINNSLDDNDLPF